jgi:hypothetical protein
MPGKQVKRWDVYHALREKGESKEKAAKIANSSPEKKVTEWQKEEAKKKGKK